MAVVAITPTAIPAFAAALRLSAGVDVALADGVWVMPVEDAVDEDAVDEDAPAVDALAFADFDAQGVAANSHGSTQPY
ncbi:hypothetical protein GP486_005481 [Trichoglossum hirsutum]|uniref:Uncharacterized protein n=1 Tax=Trichoglossum hirsutum TaxID=265104 RepID=A0A9P8L927_9PEZI|nr:hypothetical protein GP486_005481 [Trichoglossum hirsutum]